MISTNDRQKLLVPGYGGHISHEELAYIKAQLQCDRHLRARWGFKRGTGRLSDDNIRMVAMFGVGDC